MTSLRPRADHQEAVSRRLALLTAELASTQAEEPAEGADEPWLDGHTRIRPLRAVPDSGPAPVPVRVPDSPPVVPIPGRHAARRGVASLLPEAVRGRVALGPTQLVVVAVLVAVGIAVTGWWVVRGDSQRLEAPSAPSASGAPLSETAAPPLADATPAAAGRTPAAATGSVTVDVTGKVRDPGIVVLDGGARVVDAVEAAGGARRRVDLSSLNLARVPVDGEQIVVGGSPAPTGGAAAAAGTGAASAAGPLVNLNTETQPELEALPEVGPVTAQSILSWRTEHGGFTSVDELLEVDGIGDATLAQIAPHVTI